MWAAFYVDPLPWSEPAERLGLADHLDKRFGTLSGGQQQRLSIALALVGRPRVAILDELSTGLTPRAGRRSASRIRTRTTFFRFHTPPRLHTVVVSTPLGAATVALFVAVVGRTPVLVVLAVFAGWTVVCRAPSLLPLGVTWAPAASCVRERGLVADLAALLAAHPIHRLLLLIISLSLLLSCRLPFFSRSQPSPRRRCSRLLILYLSSTPSLPPSLSFSPLFSLSSLSSFSPSSSFSSSPFISFFSTSLFFPFFSSATRVPLHPEVEASVIRFALESSPTSPSTPSRLASVSRCRSSASRWSSSCASSESSSTVVAPDRSELVQPPAACASSSRLSPATSPSSPLSRLLTALSARLPALARVAA